MESRWFRQRCSDRSRGALARAGGATISSRLENAYERLDTRSGTAAFALPRRTPAPASSEPIHLVAWRPDRALIRAPGQARLEAAGQGEQLAVRPPQEREGLPRGHEVTALPLIAATRLPAQLRVDQPALLEALERRRRQSILT